MKKQIRFTIALFLVLVVVSSAAFAQGASEIVKKEAAASTVIEESTAQDAEPVELTSGATTQNPELEAGATMGFGGKGQKDFGDRGQKDFGGGMNFGGGMGLNEDAELSTSLDFSSYSESVSSPENPLTYYDAEDILDASEYESIQVKLNNGELETSSLPEGVTIVVNEDGNVVITNAGKTKVNYVLSGSWEGTVMVTSKKANYMVTLDNVHIVGKTLPGMQLKSETKAFLYLVGENYVSDSADNSKKGALTSGGDVIINGEGSLTVECFKKHGLKVDGTIRICSGNVYVITDENAEGNAISVDDAFIMDDGYLNINAKGSVYCSESKGVKVNGRELEENAKGYLIINGGTIEIESVGKALTAGWKLAEDAETETTADDPTPNLIVNGGIIRLKTTGTPYEYSDEESLSPEGLEAKNLLQINGGYIEAVTTDDAMNAGNAIEINGGWIMVYARGNDAIDSNGTIVINDGTVVALGGSGIEMGIDCDASTAFTYHGGTVVSVAGGGSNTPAASDTDGCAISFQSSGAFAILDSEGKLVLAYDIPSFYSAVTYVEVLSPVFQLGETYTIQSGISIETEDYFNGLAVGETTVSGGFTSSTLTLESYVTGSYGMDFSGGNFGGFRGGMTRPEGMTMPEGMTPPEGMTMPEGMTPPEGMSMPEGMQQPPQGFDPSQFGPSQNRPGRP